ncbi:MAG: T9SS type A sorting domain-containing protein [Bacteroidota bacterium]
MKHLFLLILFLAAPAIMAQTFNDAVRVNDAPAGTTEHSPCMRIGLDGTIYTSWFQRNADIYFTRSTDQGATFRPAIRACQQVTTNDYTSKLQRVPQFAVDRRGTIHMVWTEDRVNKQSDVWYIRSTDQGSSWTAPVSIMDADDSSKYPQDFAGIAIDSSDNIYVAFLDFRDVVRGTGDYPHLLVTRSLDEGKSWEKPVKADNFPAGIPDGGTCDCCRLDVAAGGSGDVYVAFRSDIKNRRDVWIARSLNSGKSFEKCVLAQSGVWTIAACPTTGPQIVLDRSGNLHLTWRDSRDASGRDICYYTMLPKGATAVLPNKIISRPTNQTSNWPSIVVSPNGGMMVMYQARNGGTQQIRYSISGNGGNTWSADLPLPGPTNVDQQFANLAYDRSGDIYAVWQDARRDGSDIYAAKLGGSIPVSAPPSSVMLLKPVNGKDGASTRLSWHPPAELGSAPIVWYELDISGPRNFSLSSITDTLAVLDSLAPGKYRYEVMAWTITGHSEASLGEFTIGELGVDDAGAVAGAVMISPNPVTAGGATMRLALEREEMVDIRLIDLMGRDIYQRSGIFPAGRNAVALDLPSMPPGIYLCELHTRTTTQRTRLVVE